MRTRIVLTALATPVVCATLATGCGATRHRRAPAHASQVAQSRCLGGPGAPAAPVSLLIPIGKGLAGCPSPGPARLPLASLPYLGIRCHVGNWAGCDRVGVGVNLSRPAILVIVQVDGHLVTLSPPSTPGSELWEGVLRGIGPRHGPLAVRARHGYWYGEPPVTARVRVTAYFADGTAATRAGIGYLHAGWG